MKFWNWNSITTLLGKPRFRTKTKSDVSATGPASESIAPGTPMPAKAHSGIAFLGIRPRAAATPQAKRKAAAPAASTETRAQPSRSTTDPASIAAAERARCGMIFAEGLKAGLPELAGALAADTDMPAASAIAAIKNTKRFAGRRGNLAQEMAAVKIPDVGSDVPRPLGDAGDANDLVMRAHAVYDALTISANSSRRA